MTKVWYVNSNSSGIPVSDPNTPVSDNAQRLGLGGAVGCVGRFGPPLGGCDVTGLAVGDGSSRSGASVGAGVGRRDGLGVGLVGLVGEVGVDGDVGVDGEVGVDGPEGPVGLVGDVGVDGEDGGDDGDDGREGSDGGEGVGTDGGLVGCLVIPDEDGGLPPPPLSLPFPDPFPSGGHSHGTTSSSSSYPTPSCR